MKLEDIEDQLREEKQKVAQFKSVQFEYDRQNNDTYRLTVSSRCYNGDRSFYNLLDELNEQEAASIHSALQGAWDKIVSAREQQAANVFVDKIKTGA